MARPVVSLALAFLSSASALAFVACGGPPSPPPTVPEPPPVASEKPAPTASAVAAPSAEPPKDEPSPSPKKAEPPPFGGEDPGTTVALTGPKAWTLVERGTVGVYTLVEVKGTKATFKGFAGEGTFTVPSAFTRPLAKPAKLKKGDAVLYTVVTSGACGRVVEVKGDEVAIAYPWGGQISKREVPADELLPLTGKTDYGTPVTVLDKDDATRVSIETLVFDDGKTAWVANSFGETKKVPRTSVKAIDLAPLKVGAVVAVRGEVGKIVKVLDDALQYEVQLGSATTSVKVELCDLVKSTAKPAALPKKK